LEKSELRHAVYISDDRQLAKRPLTPEAMYLQTVEFWAEKRRQRNAEASSAISPLRQSLKNRYIHRAGGCR
jgi:hypothetical protein